MPPEIKDIEDKMVDKNITSEDLMNFLQTFKTSMEERMDKNKGSMEVMMEDKLVKIGKKIDVCFDDIDNEIKNLKEKATISDDAAIRMDRRLQNLEMEMNKTIISSRRREALKDTLNTDSVRDQQEGRSETRNQTTGEKDGQPSDWNDFGGNLRESYQSEWARTMTRELSEAADAGDSRRNKGQYSKNDLPPVQPAGKPRTDNHPANEKEKSPENGDNEVPERWEQLIPKTQKPKVRKPPKILQWFGVNTDTDSTEDTDDKEWSEVDNKKINDIKKKKQKKKKRDLEETTARRASNMIGIGPINLEKLENYRKYNKTYEDMKIEVIKDFLCQ